MAVNIKKTREKGWGVFAGSEKIPKGKFLGIYAGELLNFEESERRGRYVGCVAASLIFLEVSDRFSTGCTIRLGERTCLILIFTI